MADTDRAEIDPLRGRLYRRAAGLSLFTIGFNLLEGLASVSFGWSDDSLTLFGFGIDSFIEALSAAGIYVMIRRIVRNPASDRGAFETSALKVTGTSFYILSAGLMVSVIWNLLQGSRPETTLPGAVISLFSIASMLLLIRLKLDAGRKLGSAPILADANCTRACVYMSLVLLASSAVYELTGFAYADAMGTLGIVWFSVKEGRESFGKAKGMDECSCERDVAGGAAG